MKRTLRFLGLSTLLLGVAVMAAEEGKLEGIKCPVSGQPVKAEHTVAYAKAEVYFCCPNCPKAFKENTAKFTEKANKQLVQTEQYVQKACPLAGRPVKVKAGENPEVGFCCENCLGKYNDASDEEKLKLVFAKAPFEKGFELKKKEESKE